MKTPPYRNGLADDVVGFCPLSVRYPSTIGGILGGACSGGVGGANWEDEPYSESQSSIFAMGCKKTGIRGWGLTDRDISKM